jgi:tetratricopeptide (TPR) repeat protein
MKANRPSKRDRSAPAPVKPPSRLKWKEFSAMVAAVALIGLTLWSGWFAWRLSQQREITPVVRAAIPAVPPLKTFPRLFADRVNLSTAAARQHFQPLKALEELALLYHANGFAREAEQVERGLRTIQPSDVRWTYYLADLRLTAGDAAEAVMFLQETLRVSPDHAPAELKLADVLFRLGRFEEAAAHYRRRLALVPGDPYAQLGLARISMQAGDWLKAASELEGVLRTNPKFSTAHNLLGEIRAQLGDNQAAAEHRRLGTESGRFREAADPMMAQLHEWSYDSYRLEVLGEMNQQHGKLEQSLPFYEQAVRVGVADGAAYNALGSLYQMLGRLEEAKTTLERGLAVSPQTESLYGTLSEVLRKESKPAEAVALLQRAVQQLPNSPELRNDLGMALEEAGRDADAIAAYREAILRNPNYPEAHFNLGLRLRATGKVAEAAPHFRRMLESRPSDSKTLLVLAQDEIRAGRFDAADTYLRALETHHPDLAEGRRLRGNWHLRRGMAAAAAGQPAAAEAEFRAGLAVNPEQSLLVANLGTLLAQKGNHAEALTYFERFVKLAPHELSAHLYLGQALLALNRVDEARRALEQGVALARQAQNAQPNARNTEVIARLDQLLREINAR